MYSLLCSHGYIYLISNHPLPFHPIKQEKNHTEKKKPPRPVRYARMEIPSPVTQTHTLQLQPHVFPISQH